MVALKRQAMQTRSWTASLPAEWRGDKASDWRRDAARNGDEVLLPVEPELSMIQCRGEKRGFAKDCWFAIARFGVVLGAIRRACLNTACVGWGSVASDAGCGCDIEPTALTRDQVYSSRSVAVLTSGSCSPLPQPRAKLPARCLDRQCPSAAGRSCDANY
jgi:hypothetical protein